MKKVNLILLVDDDEVNNYINQLLLKKIGIANEIHIAITGREAINYLNKADKGSLNYPNIIMLDINMPGMDGFEFLDEYKQLNHKEKATIIALTTSNLESDVMKMKNLGVRYYLNKPLEAANLYSLMESLASTL